MQPLLKPMHRSILCPFHSFLLRSVFRISFCCKSMMKPREILVIIRHAQGWNDLVAKLLQLGREHRIEFRRHDLHGHAHILDLALLEERRVRRGDAVNEINILSTQTKHSPATEAEPNGCNTLV